MLVKYSKDKKVAFYEEDHKYIKVDDGQRFTSVTTKLHEYVNPFDPDGSITSNYAKKHKKTVPEVIEEWRIINVESCEYGTEVHNGLENFVVTGEYDEDWQYSWIINQFAEINFTGKLFPEVLIYSLLYMIAGQVDLIEDLGNKTINIWDYKTNKKLEKKSFWGHTMKQHLWYLDDVNFNVYQLQLSMYAYLCELKGLTINKLFILYVNRKSKKIEHHECKYLRDEVMQILKSHKIK